jgi:hypothetical protein
MSFKYVVGSTINPKNQWYYNPSILTPKTKPFNLISTLESPFFNQKAIFIFYQIKNHFHLVTLKHFKFEQIYKQQCNIRLFVEF